MRAQLGLFAVVALALAGAFGFYLFAGDPYTALGFAALFATAVTAMVVLAFLLRRDSKRDQS